MKRKMKCLKALALSLALGITMAFPASAAWQNESLGPGAAQWIEEVSPDGTVASQPAPDAGSHFTAPEDHSTTYIDGQPVSLTTPEGTSLSVPEIPVTGTEATESDTPAAPEETAPADTAQPETQTPQQEAAQPETSQETAQASENPNLVASNGRMVDITKPMVALTYDDGPYAPVGNRIMDIAEQYNGRVTFFMVGDRVKTYATEVKRMVQNGHEVANHTYSHKYLNKLDAASIRSQVEQCNNVIQEVTGVRPTVMRLPGGNKNSTVLQNVNMPIILWNIDTRDWATKNAAKTIDAVLGKVKDGDIILMHELYSSTADAAATIIPELSAQGYQLVTVSELAKFKGKSLAANQIYYSIR